MSEYINNVSKRKAALREVIKKLHQGASVESLTEEFGEIIRYTNSSEIAEAERDMISEGIPVTDIQQLCDLHVAVFRGALETAPAPESLPGHPVYEFRKENELIDLMLGSLEDLLSKMQAGDEKSIEAVRSTLHNLDLIERHFDRKENLFFPYLENHNFQGPSTVMWGVDNEIRAKIKNLIVLMNSQTVPVERARQVFKEMATQTRDMIYKEEKIMIPETLNRFSEKEWDVIRAEYQLVKPSYPAVEEPSEVAETSEETGGRLPLSTGALTLEQINLLLTNLPVDVTFVDENDEVRFYSQTRERIFTRTEAIIGRKVQNCHPPQSVHVVQKIVDSFRAGTRDVAEFWIEMGESSSISVILRCETALGVYKGTIEVTQDATSIRGLTGERRLLDD